MAPRRTSFGFSRRAALGAVVGALALLALTAWGAHHLRPAQGRPNIIVIMTDDQRWDSLQAMPTAKRELAARGVTFANAFATTPACCPSRASFLTGLYVHNHGVWQNRGPQGGFQAFKDRDTLPVWLQDAGYTTALIGKYLNGYRQQTYIPPGWDRWHAFTRGNYYDYVMNQDGTLVRYGTEPEDYSTDVVQRQALRFIQEQQESRRPFFLLITPNNPHGDNKNSDRTGEHGISTPAPRHRNRCDDVGRHRPPSFNERDVSDKPAAIRHRPPLTATKIAKMDDIYRSQACSLKAVDDLVGQVVAALDDRDATAVVLLTDNGRAYGEHRAGGKGGCLYEECTRIPLIISYPKLHPGSRRSQSLATNIDVTATIADLAGARPAAKANGRSLLPILADPSRSGRTAILLERQDDTTRRPEVAVRTGRYKYVEKASGETELYDLLRDPFELANLAGKRAYSGVTAELSVKLARLRAD